MCRSDKAGGPITILPRGSLVIFHQARTQRITTLAPAILVPDCNACREEAVAGGPAASVPDAESGCSNYVNYVGTVSEIEVFVLDTSAHWLSCKSVNCVRTVSEIEVCFRHDECPLAVLQEVQPSCWIWVHWVPR